jgi:2-polyprenyl-6-methoxyphenol hydroxylase-like FAD-dependent oxidoreductase
MVSPINDADLSKLILSVLIVGAGPAGCATALSFIKSKPSATFVVIDDSTSTPFKVGHDILVSIN